MEHKQFAGATIELISQTEDDVLDFELDLDEISESFYDSFYESLKNDAAEEHDPDELSQQARAMLDALVIEFEDTDPDSEEWEIDQFNSRDGHYTIPGGTAYNHMAIIKLSVNPDSEVKLNDFEVDIVVSDYTENYCSHENTYYNNNALAEAREKQAALMAEIKAKREMPEKQPDQKPEQAPDELSKPKFTP